jgi:hypothetical protein
MCVTLLKWLVAILSFATDRFFFWFWWLQNQVAQPSQPTSFAVAKLSIATSHMLIASSQPSQPAE